MNLRLLLLMLIALPVATSAAIIDVPADQPTVQAGIDYASPDDTVRLDDGTYYESVQIIFKPLTLLSRNGRDVTSIYSASSRALTIYNAAGITLRGISFTGKYSWATIANGGSILIDSSTVEIKECRVINSISTQNGGGICAISSEVLIDSCEIIENLAEYPSDGITGHTNFGGGIYALSGTMSIRNSQISNNTCSPEDAFGGGIYIASNGFEISNCVIEDNTAHSILTTIPSGLTGRGGGIYIIGNWGTIELNEIRGNTASSITRFSGAVGAGGGIYLDGDGNTVTYNLIEKNLARGEYWDGGTDSEAHAYAGGIYARGDNSVVNNTIVGNMASGYGAVAYMYCRAKINASGGGCSIYDGEFLRNIIAYDTVETYLEIMEFCEPGCLPYCEQYTEEASGVKISVANDDWNIIWENEGTVSEWVGSSNNLINADPLFCSLNPANYRIYSPSPGAPYNNGGGRLIGAFPVGCVYFLFGDVNKDGACNVGDIVYLINYVFKSGPAPDPVEAGDVNCDGSTNVGDIVFLINYVFKSGPPPGCYE